MKPAERWRQTKKPVLHIRLPFFFMADEPAMMRLLPPILGLAMRRWPGSLVSDRFPLRSWPRLRTEAPFRPA